MREALRPYGRTDQLNYLCVIAAELMGEMSLRRIPSLGAGFQGVSETLSPNVDRALQNLRIAGFYPGTIRELQLMVDNYKTHHRMLEMRRASGEHEGNEIPQRYVINEDLTIERTWTQLMPEDVLEAIQSLTLILPLRASAVLALQDPMQKSEVVYEQEGYNGLIQPLGFLPEEPPIYPSERIGQAPGHVAWKDLVAVADVFDTLDVAAGMQQADERSWFRRLHDAAGDPTALLLTPGKGGLEVADGLDLVGVKHLIGLPGAGKTTLLYLLAGHMYHTGYSTCFLFPSIEVASGFIEVLARYRIPVGLLSGQSETSRTRHVLNFATALSSQNHGFGATREVASFFATNCALSGFASDEDVEFPHDNPPCEALYQKLPNHKRPTKHRCALSSVCGYRKAERTLTRATLWAGHILSTDRRVSSLYSDVQIRHFEFLARTFDLLIVDECDGAQSAMDGRGTPVLKMMGDSDSVWHSLLLDLHGQAAGSQNAFMSGLSVPTLMEMTGRFGRATERLMARIMHFDEKFRNYYSSQLLTALGLISDMYAADSDLDDEEADAYVEARKAFETLWDASVKMVAFRTLNTDDEEEQASLERLIAEAARLMNKPPEEIAAFQRKLTESIDIWDRDASQVAMEGLVRVLRETPGLHSSADDTTFFAYTALLTCVSLVVLQHFGLAPHLRLMNSMGLVSDDVFESRPSRDLLAFLPESLIGRLSGVRYTVSEEGNVNISHVGFSGTPRMMTDRMVRIGQERNGGGMAVLLTSATSMLEQSPSFHVSVGPDYVLRRPNAGHGWKDSRYAFHPKPDPQNPNVMLRFSGARMTQRDRILSSMADQLLRGGRASDVESAIAENDIRYGVGRKAAFIVNSYDQCQMLFDHIHANHTQWRGRVRFLTRATLQGGLHEAAVTASEVESLGDDRSWDILIFPMNAIGRGVNIVYRYGPRQGQAMLGSLYFLTRPHPRGDSLTLIQGLVGRASENFDRLRFESTEEALDALRDARRKTSLMIEYLLRIPLSAQRLGEYIEPFVADQMIIILQTIGRAMRGDCPAFVYFVDAAWAPASARGEGDTPRTSMLVMMQTILKRCLNHPEASKRECYRDLYQSFADPLSRIGNLIIEG